jgi:hypothetical protein
MFRSCVRSHRCAFVVIMVMNMVIVTTIVSANQPPNTRLHRLRHGRLCTLCWAPGVSGWGYADFHAVVNFRFTEF